MTDTLTFRRYTAMVVPLYVVVDAQGIIRYAESHLPDVGLLGGVPAPKRSASADPRIVAHRRSEQGAGRLDSRP